MSQERIIKTTMYTVEYCTVLQYMYDILQNNISNGQISSLDYIRYTLLVQQGAAVLGIYRYARMC